mgnify:CR=1 FL=1
MKSVNMEKRSDGLMAQVVELAQKNYTKTEISKRAGVSRTTVSRWLKSVERESQKGIIIGKRGAMLKKIGERARADIERFMGTKVYLTTWVKVKENWRDSDFLVRNFGYTE